MVLLLLLCRRVHKRTDYTVTLDCCCCCCCRNINMRLRENFESLKFTYNYLVQQLDPPHAGANCFESNFSVYDLLG